jgi:hypothetical protein
MTFIFVSFSPVIYLAFEGAATNKKEVTFKKNGKKFQPPKIVSYLSKTIHTIESSFSTHNMWLQTLPS